MGWTSRKDDSVALSKRIDRTLRGEKKRKDILKKKKPENKIRKCDMSLETSKQLIEGSV